MSTASTAFAKLAGILKASENTLNDEFFRKGQRPIQAYSEQTVGYYFNGAERAVATLREALPELFGDFPVIGVTPETEMSQATEGKPATFYFSRQQLQTLVTTIQQVLEVYAHSELETPQQSVAPVRRVFISHGRAADWREIQAYIEKDIGLNSLELAQEPNQGRTILGKLADSAGQCDSAVIVMTGDDLDAEGQARARENVIHEIGYFQGRYGLDRVILLHEDGVSIPSNIQGVVYTPFAKGAVSACTGLLARELKSIYR